MAFLTLNGLRVPVAAEEASRTVEDTGRASRGATGQLTKDRRWAKRKWEVTTPPISSIEYQALKGILTRRAYTWAWDNSPAHNVPAPLTWDSFIASYSQANGADGTPVIGGARFGAAALVMNHYGVNLLPDNAATGTDTAGTTSGFTAIAGGALASSTARAWQGAKSLRLDTATAGDGCAATGSAAASGYRFAASLYITGAGTYQVAVRDGTTVLASTAITAVPGSWSRAFVAMTTNLAAPTTTLNLAVTRTDTGAATAYIDGLLLEGAANAGVNNVPNVWHTGTVQAGAQFVRPATLGLYGSREGVSLNMWVAPLARPGAILASLQAYGASAGKVLVACATYTNSIFAYGGLVPGLFVTNAVGTVSPLVLPSFTFPTPGTWRMLTAVVCPSPPQGCSSLSLYVDGVLAAEANPALGFDPTLLDLIYWGGENGTGVMGTPLDECTLFPYPLGPTTVAGLFEASTTMPTSYPQLTADGLALASGPVQVTGQIEKAEAVTFTDPRGHTHNLGVTATFTLLEM